MRATSTLIPVVLCTALMACGGSKDRGERAADPAERERAAAVASVQRLAASVRDADAPAACRSLSRATRRVVALVGRPGATCSSAVGDFLVVHGLRRSLPATSDLAATVRGARAEVRGAGLPAALTATRGTDGWRVSLVGLPGVRGDIAAARACGRWIRRADTQGLPPFDPVALAARLRREAQQVDRLRRALVALPPGGPARLGLADVVGALTAIRAGLLAQAVRVEAGGPLDRGIQATARGDRLVRLLLADEASKARVACPRDATRGAELAARRTILDAACEDYGAAIDGLDGAPETYAEAQAGLRRVDAALARLDRALRRAPVGPRLRRLRAQSRQAVGDMRAAVAALGSSPGGAAFEAAGRRVEGRGAQVDAALIRLGATCLDADAPSAPPRRSSPQPGATPDLVES